MIGNLFHALVATGAPDRARRLVESEAPKITVPSLQARLWYVLAMLHARYLPAKDLAAAEAFLRRAVAAVPASEVADDQKHFLSVFFGNGLAFVLHRRGRSDEAIALCRAGVATLETHLGPERHRLHRSVLLFNIAQVLVATGAFAEAIEHFTAAMAIDPNYSEYYNDRGSALLRLGRLEEALADYRRAIALSPPYPQVRTNLGHCLRLLARFDEAVAAYGAALDLAPDDVAALDGRAQAHDALGRADDALADYDRLLRLSPDRPEALANRAALRYERGAVAEALSDLDRAIELAPAHADLYANRAVALEALGRAAAAMADLRRCVELTDDAPARQAAAERLARLAAGAEAAACDAG